ncbi:hypothetical protein [Phormidium tenue]|nr:hypothetical protein [Phormidium tenue]
MQIRYESLLETDESLDWDGAIALVSSLYVAAVSQVSLAGE